MNPKETQYQIWPKQAKKFIKLFPFTYLGEGNSWKCLKWKTWHGQSVPLWLPVAFLLHFGAGGFAQRDLGVWSFHYSLRGCVGTTKTNPLATECMGKTERRTTELVLLLRFVWSAAFCLIVTSYNLLWAGQWSNGSMARLHLTWIWAWIDWDY